MERTDFIKQILVIHLYIEFTRPQSLWLWTNDHKIKLAYPCKKVGVTVIGLEVPHAHIHLVPINSLADMNFSSPKLSLTPDELVEIATQLQKA